MLLVLNYHHISDQSENDLFSLSPNMLKDQLNLIRDLGIKVVPFKKECSLISPFSIALTFDDGNKSDYEIVLPLLSSFNFNAAFFPFIKNINTSQGMNWEQIRHLSQYNYLIGSHGLNHQDLTTLSPSELNRELLESKETLEHKIGKPILDFALPYGAYNNLVIERAQFSGYKSVSTTGLRINNGSSNLIFRWNITRDTSLKELSLILQSGGKLPLKTQLHSAIKHRTKKILGSRLSNYLNQLR